MKLQNFNSLWVGNNLSYIERLCLVSGMAVGHNFTLWSYEPENLQNVPDGVELRNAAEVMPRERLLTYAGTTAVALGANFWRYEMLAKGLGYWVDMDLYFIRPFDYSEEYVFGWEYEGQVNNAVILAPQNSQMVKDLNSLPKANRKPAWFGPKRSLLYYWQRLTKGHIGLEDMPWGTYGPGMLTYVMQSNGLEKFAQPPTAFYPVRYDDALDLFEPAEIIEKMLSEETKAIHLYHSRLAGMKDKPPPVGSYLDLACKKHNIDTSI